MNNNQVLYNYGEWTIYQHERDRFALRFISWEGRRLDSTGRWADEAVYKMLLQLRGMLWREMQPKPEYKWV